MECERYIARCAFFLCDKELYFSKMKISFLIILILVVFSCKQKRINCIRPFNQKEVLLIDSINDIGQSVKITRLNYLYGPDSLEFCSKDLDFEYRINIKDVDSIYINNQDSMRIYSRKLASKLYNSIIEDSILYYTENFWFTFIRKDYRKHKKDDDLFTCDYQYFVKIEKIDLENCFGYKIINQKNGFKELKMNLKRIL